MSSFPISAVVLTYNSARTLSDVLESISWCGEILVVDSGSTDETKGIAEKYGGRFIERRFTGYGDQKKFAVSSARYDWVFVVDSDEVVSHALKNEIQEKFQSGHGDVSGYTVPIRLIFLGEKMKYSGNTVKDSLRIFNRQNGNFNLALVHELVELKGTYSRFSHPMWHYSYLTLDDYFQKFNRYTTFGAQEIYRMRKRPKMLKIWIGLPIYFFKMYILRFGFLDGYHGFMWCLLSALYSQVCEAERAVADGTAGNSRGSALISSAWIGVGAASTALLYAVFRYGLFLPRVLGIPVLMYHKVSRDERDFLTVTEPMFERQLRWLSDRGFQSISMRQFLEFIEGKLSRDALPARPLLITFDDGYECNHRLVLPILRKHCQQACLFVTTSYIEARESGADLCYMNLAELKDWTEQGMEVALHSHRHQNYKHETIDAILSDLADNRKKLKEWGLNFQEALAYPFGGRPKSKTAFQELKQKLEETGLRAAFRIGNRIHRWKEVAQDADRFDVCRIDIRGDDPFFEFKVKVLKGRSKVF